jgi:ribosomal protein S18 acetylase RimI-like enzyme
MLYWVAEDRKEIRGYILWVEKGGFRKEAVLELEQIAVDAAFRRKGIGTTLVRESLKGLRSILHDRGSSLKLIEVTTGTEQGAVDFYRRTLGAELVARLPDVFRGDEIVLFARPPRA